MKDKFTKAAIFVAAIILVASSYIAGLHAQQSPATPAKPPATTNWLGYLVVGQNDTLDSISIIGPHPVVDRRMEIGLSSDGVLVWRKAAK